MAYNNSNNSSHYNQYGGNPYSQGPTAETGYGYTNNAGQQEQHEMQPLNGQQHDGPHYQQPAAPPTLSQQDFLAQVNFTRGEIRQLTSDVQAIAGLHQRGLSGDDAAQNQLAAHVEETSRRTTSIRSSIKTLKSDVEHTTDHSLSMKKQQWTALNDAFKTELRTYMEAEQRYRESYREQIARQYRIVNPAATEEEVRRAADANWGDEGVFQQALRQNRAAQGRAVLGAVRARHNELKQIEQSIVELAAMFNDLDTLVLQQAPMIAEIEQKAEDTVQNLDQGNAQVAKGAELAKNRRKLKWWCLGISIVIVIAILIAVLVVLYNSGVIGNKNPPAKQ
ncbi:hypothetical protein GGTG_00693 [Gaeumannomyces tritici R3-111a-1]|uniref:t-SNARE coiled-coil homology domain-containing protein n=1 Tax=Gaeumannomyces tritici (strain R3-111a-1) TaxID=644352 RepID=J3NHF6_GAET3|nr:hypothetical protein GGTG_00693 [Gaeumannomyces tritici R3-111a-1]EJT80699.1 hypothetical protein GGTG_00693 [Gaeumannomyces tritici R3-111a-1]